MNVPARRLALPLCLLTGCATATASTPTLLPSDLHVGALDQRTRFELDDQSGGAGRDESDRDAKRRADTPKKKRRRKGLFILGAGAAGLGVLGVTGFGIGGRIVQGQIASGYDDGSLTRDDEDRLTSTGELMNGLTIGSAVLGLVGVVLAATTYGIDHARCGDLPPRRKQCPDREAPADDDAK